MPDLADVEQGLLAVLSQALLTLPLATQAGSLLTTESGQQILTDQAAGYLPMDLKAGPGGVMMRLYRGWPTGAELTAELRQGRAHVTVFADGAMARNTTRYMSQYGVQILPPPLTMSLVGIRNHVTVNGTPAVGQVCGLLVHTASGSAGYAYRVMANDTPSIVAAALASLVPGATSNGSAITMPTDRFVPRVVQDVGVAAEVRRQDQVFRISFWCPDPATRDTLSAAADAVMAPLSRITLVSGWTCYVRYHGTRVDDMVSLAGVWRRDLLYSVEYPTAPAIAATEMLFGYLASGPAAPLTV